MGKARAKYSFKGLSLIELMCVVQGSAASVFGTVYAYERIFPDYPKINAYFAVGLLVILLNHIYFRNRQPNQELSGFSILGIIFWFNYLWAISILISFF